MGTGDQGLRAAATRVAVLGGGLQGCCTALALDALGIKVTLFDRNDALLTRAAIANEGKIHLGYMYAADPSLATARMMMRGALDFAPFFQKHLGRNALGTPSDPAVYLVHAQSQRTSDQVGAYLAQTHELVVEAAAGRTNAYLGQDLTTAPRAWNSKAQADEFGPDICAAFDTPEVAINPETLAEAVRAAIHASSGIELRLNCLVTAVEDPAHPTVFFNAGSGRLQEGYDHVVNALWDGRLAIDRMIEGPPSRPWIHRLKYGVSFRQQRAIGMRSATIVSGPFGEVVSYPDGLVYLTWYPACLRAISRELKPPDWPNRIDGAVSREIIEQTFQALSSIVRGLGAIQLEDVHDLRVKGGPIIAWGRTDIYDPQSELHGRWRIGITSRDRFHSIDPGKLTMAPHFADECARRITGK